MTYLQKIPFLAVLLFFMSCGENKKEPVVPKSDEKSQPKLTIGYNENIETLALIYNLSESGDFHFNEIIGPRGTLAKELTNPFGNYRNHEAVIKLNALLNDGFVDLYDVMLSLYHSPLPEFKQMVKYPSIYYENEGLTSEETQARFDDFNNSVAQFYMDADLKNHFENEYKKLYQKIMNEVGVVAPNEDFIKEAESFYGIQRDSYEMIISSFSFNGIGKAILIDNQGITKAFCLVTSNHLLESDTIDLSDLNSFIIGYNDKKYFQEIGLHELIHTFFYEALNENKENVTLINELDYLFTDSLKKDMMNQGYIDWRTCFEEHLVRVGEVKIAERLGNNDFVQEYRLECIQKRGFVYFELIENLLSEYENNRNQYKNIEDFIPELVNIIKTALPQTPQNE